MKFSLKLLYCWAFVVVAIAGSLVKGQSNSLQEDQGTHKKNQSAEKHPSVSSGKFDRKIPIESAVETQHETVIKGSKITYTAKAGTQPIWAEDGHPIATLFYTYYRRTDIDSVDKRPLIISFNGGPGSASVWMHLAYTGPRILKIDDEGFPVQPYGVRDNPYSILDMADIVFVNPVNTGYSRIVDEEAEKEQFFGVNQDIEYLAEWINTFVTRANRWNSPKYLIGESYGTTRVSGLALELQDDQWMYLNGVILVSPTGLGAMVQ